MDFYIKNQLCKQYNLNSCTKVSLLHGGENQTYIFESDKNKFVVRQYREGRYKVEQIEAEIHWLIALQKQMLVPEVVVNKNGEWITSVMKAEGSIQYFVVFRFINGSEVLEPKNRDYEKLGSLMRMFHEKTNGVLKEVPQDWIGYVRPIYSEQKTIQEPLQQLLDASFLSHAEKNKCLRIAQRIQELAGSISLGEKQFVHGDMHFGNILVDKEDWYLLDFDECGYGYKEFDIGVPRLHLIASGQLNECWEYFMMGYGENVSEAVIRLGTASRLFYMAGKIPARLDIDPIRKNPGAFIQRYIQYTEKELCGETVI
ncbi:phosphotransferase [Bacillus sp. S70]|uniref:phosphotransferase enzyme family protein n=1 Tax=Bacillus TaxID=1386 RepID=UPI00190AECCE|nr:MULTISPECIES: phosphotransferase [unclassified Bacillus (in: firmicutes)]MBJ9981876.1 phosphotransferase [Bacillus sp. S29]MBK0104007.1 phosphotransferase [Bacillus sp. S70]MBK0108892.1 phosphotransferase [Bacillus sp. S73]MBK0137175.1 phosphotransferase [Bacillus sp. S72]MBK0147094.1 phosphotransferase [Bacillus sp. S74]